MMSKRRRNKHRTETKAMPIRNPAPWLEATAQSERWTTPQDGHRFAKQAELYQRLSWVWIALEHPSRYAATLGFNVKQRVKDTLEDIPNHRFELLLQTPNPLMSRFELLSSTYNFRRLTGNCYWWLNRASPTDEPSEIWIIPTQRIRPVPDEQMYLRGYLFMADFGQEIPLETWQVVHFKGWHPFDSFVGMSPVEPLATVAIGDLAMQTWNTNFFDKNNAKTSGFLAFSDPINDSDWTKMQNDLKNQAGGTRRQLMMLRGAGKGGAEWISTNISQEEMQFLESRGMTKEEIYAVFAPGLSSVLAVNATEANSTAGKDTMLEFAVWPMMVEVGEKITTDILPAYGDDLKGEFDDPRRKDRELELKEQDAFSRVHTVDEVRAKYYQALPIGDQRGMMLPQQISGSGSTDSEGDTKQPILGYHIETGAVTKNEVRETLALPPIDEREDEAQRRRKAKLEIMTAARKAGMTKEEAAAYADVEVPAVVSAPTIIDVTPEPEQRQLPPPAVKAEYSGGMIALFIPPMIAEQLAIQVGTLPDAEILPAEDLHITLVALHDAALYSDQMRGAIEWVLVYAASKHGALEVQTSGIGLFTSDQVCLHLTVDGVQLNAFRQTIVDTLDEIGIPYATNHGFDPHITLAYLSAIPATLPIREPQRMIIDTATVAWGDERIPIQMYGHAVDLIGDLERYERKAIKALKAGKSAAVPFESDAIPADVAEDLRTALGSCWTSADVRQAFASIKKSPLTPVEQTLADAVLAVLMKWQPKVVRAILNGEQPDKSGLEPALRAAVMPTMVDYILSIIESLGEDIGLDIDPAAAATTAATWASTYSYNLVKGIVSTTETLLQQALSTYMDTPGMTREALESLLKPAFGAVRAEMVAVTEITRTNAQAVSMYQQYLAEAGIEMERVNHTNADDRVCRICGPLNGKPESEWPNPEGPPWHVRCRCFPTLRRKRDV